MPTAESCHGRDCSRPVVVTFRAQALCLDHFCTRCYELLDEIDRCQRCHSGTSACTAEHGLIADECAARALDVCMSETLLNNLERARLLDILLWCGDLSSLHRGKNARAVFERRRTLDEKPELKPLKSGSALPF